MENKMSKLHICITFVILGYTIAAPVLETPESELSDVVDDVVTIVEDNPGLDSRDEETNYKPQEIIFEIIQTKDAAQLKDVLVIDEVDEDDDMELAETHIFRPLFRYRAQLERRKRIGKPRS